MKKYILTVLIILALPPLLCAEYLGSWKIGDVVTFTANTHSPTTGAATDADSVPVYRVYENETGAPLLTGSMMLLDSDNTDGFYSEQITLSEASGFEKGKTYTVYIGAAVGGVAGSVAHKFQIEAEVDANTVSGSVASVTGTVNANLTQISGDSSAADTLESYCDGNAYMPVNLMRVNSQQYIEGTYTPLAWLRLQGASLFGDVENSETTYYFRDVADSKARITIDLSGSNRNTIALDGD